PEFWNEQAAAREAIGKNNHLKKIVEGFREIERAVEDIEVTHELLKEEYDEEMKADIEKNVRSTQEKVDAFELDILLDEEHDSLSALLELHPGAGGTESKDWAEMLVRMYHRYCEYKGWKVDTLDYQDGDEAGVKSVTLSVKGANAYGLLKAEKGIHRLVRISPFDSSGRRHTSFVSCEITPQFENNDIEIEINNEDISIDTYRASGAGGQHVNTTD